MSAALGLFRLQQIDRQLDQAEARLAAIRMTLENDNDLRSALALVESGRTARDNTQQLLRETEARVAEQVTKIKQAEASLYGGSVRNPKELQDLQEDVAALKRYLVTLEERELEAMLLAEKAEAELTSVQAQLEALQSVLGDQHRGLFEERAELTKDLDRLHAERQAVLGELANQALEKYEDLRQQRRGMAVAEVHESSCSACGTLLTAALRQNARSTTQMAYCPSCGRILYAD